ncbi:phosphoribosylanthranilate isomerase [Aquihabitans sp. G128]|uniref:phosphoribosylanthranilate isomerase n=1 Tax=Aquihabitans sp. G128 TaxID=2849779 RepID=UPI001C22B253|nr:phosphoribosylanthranilate isomerase [Aquihabitans sp. G128]QXC62544.1 phosphoribosylanthranilate isomerase [Aquihabitans sp. G128]
MFVKICGITREDDALLAVAMGADAVGFIFAPSKRQIAPSIARDIVKRLPPEILTVGVFRDEAPARVVDIVNSTGLRAAQLHGHESAESTRLIRARVPLVIKAFPAGDRGLDHAADYGADALLIDSPRPGSGETFDWGLAAQLPPGQRVILAGGLTPENVAAAIGQVGPWGVDVASGVESERGEPGQKDARKVKAFIDAAKAAVPAEHAGALDPAGSVLPYDWMQDDVL